MSLLPDCEQAVIQKFPGADLLRDVVDLPPGRSHVPGALLARNVEFLPGLVSTRRGVTPLFTPAITGLSVESLFNWVQADWNMAVMFSTNSGAPKVRERRFDLSTEDDVVTGLSALAVDAVFGSYGSRLLMAFLRSNGKGVDQGRIWNSTFTISANVDKLFQRPLNQGSEFSFTSSEPGAGNVTAGPHKVAVVVRTRNGYDTKPVVATTTFTAAGAKVLRVTLTPVGNWPAWVNTGRIAMTTTSNQALYFFVPGAESIGFQTVAFSPGTSIPVNFDINISDEALSTGSELTDYFFLLSQDPSGNGPFSPRFVGSYGNRIAYLADRPDAQSLGNVATWYFSEPGLPEWITEDFHRITAPDRKPMVGGFQLQNIWVMLGPSWTYTSVDTGGEPVTWPAPQVVSSRIGTSSAHGFDVNTEGGIAWVAHRDGLYVFTGTRYHHLPVSYLHQRDWNRINWKNSATGRVWVKDDVQNKRVLVGAPLDTATNISHIMVFDYQKGISWDAVDYALYNYANATAIGALEIGQNFTNTFPELWFSQVSATGKIYREKSTAAGDTSLYNDENLGITSIYNGPPVPSVFQAPVRFISSHLRVRGSGTLKVSAIDYDQLRTVSLSDVALSTVPGRDQLRHMNIQSEALHMGFSNNGVANSYFQLSRITLYWLPWVSQR